MNALSITTSHTTVPRTINLAVWLAYLGAGAAAGATAALLARVAMRVVALIEGAHPSFTLAGTLGIVTIFIVLGTPVGLIWMAMERKLHIRPVAGGVLLSLALAMLLGVLFFLAATGDLSGTSPARILRLLLLFVPVPLAMAWGTVWGAGRLEARAQGWAAKRLPRAYALAAGALTLATFLSMIPAIGGAQRHPLLVSNLLGTASQDFSGMADRSRGIALLSFYAYLGLALVALWRQPEQRSVRRGVLAVLSLPTLLLVAGSALPFPLSWLPDAAWALGLVQAVGVMTLLGVFMVAGNFTPPRRLLLGAAGAWLCAALWLAMGQSSATYWTVWLVWSMLAATITATLIMRVRRTQRVSGASTLLLALFALAWMGLWAAVLLVPGLQLRGLSSFAVTLSVSLFWAPWLLLPAGLLPALAQETGDQ